MLKTKVALFFLLSVLFIAVAVNIPYNLLTLLPSGNISLTTEELEVLKNSFNPFVSANFQTVNADEETERKINEYAVSFKLFNLFNIKQSKVSVVKENVVFAGGNCIGLKLDGKGVVVVGSNYIITKKGNINPFKESNLQVGDIVTHLNGEEVNSISDIAAVLEKFGGQTLNLVGKRGGNFFNTQITPGLDVQTNKHKLGLWVRDSTAGVGTLTFVNCKNNRFGSLGHAITDADTKHSYDIIGGEVYKCNVIGVKKGTRGAPGQLLGLFLEGRDMQGVADKNCMYGVYGNLLQENIYTKEKKSVEIGGRFTAKPGKAKILTCIEGSEVKEYSIEIIKTNYQNASSDKSMILKVTDKELLEKTGGIVQGMSGSPIIQNGKLVGAVTHVFINDPTKGFGLYLDWMLNE